MRQNDKKESKRPADGHAWQAGQDTVDASDGSWISMAVVAKGGDAGIGGDHDCERPPALRGITAQEHCEEIKRKHGPCSIPLGGGDVKITPISRCCALPFAKLFRISIRPTCLRPSN